jgi:uncharacterized protein
VSWFQELRRRWWLLLVAAVVLLLLFGARVATFYTDVLWFDTIGFVRVFWTLLSTRIWLGVAAGLVMAGLIAGNLLLAKRLEPAYRVPSAQEESIERYREAIEPFARPLLYGVALVIGVLTGLSMAAEWPTYLLWANGGEFGRVDPQFGRDLGFFVFTLPFYNLVNSWLFTTLALTIVLTAVAHYLFGGIRPQNPRQRVTPQANVHLSILLAGLVAVRAWGFWLDRFNLSYSQRGTVTGLSYTDVNAQLLAYQLLAIIAAVCVVLFLVNVAVRSWLLPSAGVGLLVVSAVILAGIYPAIIQRLQVDPQELPREQEYIGRNLELTRFAFGLDDVVFEPFPANEELPAEAVQDNRRTLESIRLWDPAVLQNTYAQLQVLRTYYDFRDVDVDRYMLDGQLTQVMLSVREVSIGDLDPTAQTWQNQRLVYTHGFGLVASDVSTARADGQPVFFVNDIPPRGVAELLVDNPRIYFGENPPEYSVVGTEQMELDYPLQGGGQEMYLYTGQDGVDIGTLGRRLAFALRYAEPNFVLSNLITDESKVLFNRRVRDRVQAVAPFLKLDHDPYPVAVDGRIKWILDAYTTTDMIPYSQRVDLGELTLAEQRVFVTLQTPQGELVVREQVQRRPGLTGTANYIRNSVKAVVDAYDGSVDLYVIDDEDPIINAWRTVFPDSFTDGDTASEDLWSHFRYPEDMFRVQASMFETYHISDVADFYFKEDAWQIPADAAAAANQAAAGMPVDNREMRPYYLLMRLPGQENEEFALIQPFTPAARPNLIAWLAGRSDGEHYGELKAFVMPPDRTVFGPTQIQARVDQEEEIARQIGVWNQSGSRVIYGNLLVIPVEDALMYAQPLFLRAERGDIPELRKVVLFLGDNVVFADTLTQGLQQMFGDIQIGAELPDGAPDRRVPDPGEVLDPRVQQLINQALAAFEEADAALREGDLGTYAERTRAAQQLLEQVRARLEGEPEPVPEPEPDAEATPEPDAEATPEPDADATPAAARS